MPKRRKVKGKVRVKSYAALKREADKVVSEWVRRKDADENGMLRCTTCGLHEHWKRLQCGHFISRVHLSCRWEARNLAPQCYACNVLRRGNPGEFALYLTSTYGPSILLELVEKKRQQVKYTRSDLETLISDYKRRLSEL